MAEKTFSYLTQKILAKHTDLSTGIQEIILLGYCDNEAASEHLSRYSVASQLVSGIVLDCASGSCYGSSILSRNNSVKLVISVDVDKDLLLYGKIVYHAECVSADAAHLPFREHVFDSVVSMETLEHIKNKDEFITGIKAALKERGQLILSTPNKLFSSPFLLNPLNPYHYDEYYLGQLITFLESHNFKIVCACGGRRTIKLEMMRRIIGTLSKSLLKSLSLKPYLIDKLNGGIFDRLKMNNKSVSLIDPDPRIYPCVRLKITSNIILYQWFMIHAYIQDKKIL